MPISNLNSLNNQKKQFAVSEETNKKVARNATSFTNSQNNKWYKGDQPTWREAMGRAYQIAETDYGKGINLVNNLRQLRSNPTSMFYNAYSQPTNRAASKLAENGFDTDLLDNGWLNTSDAQAYIRSNLVYDGATNTPKSPGKKSTADQYNAYWLTQYQAAQKDTDAAKSEIKGSQDFINYWTNAADRNLSDEQIKQKYKDEYYSKNCPTLQKMQNGADANKPLELNEAVDFSDDTIDAMIWMARNPDYTGGIEGAMAYSYLGAGNQWQGNAKISAMLDPKSPDFLPYAVGSTNLDDEAYLFGVRSFSKEWIAQNDGLQYQDTPEGKAFRTVLGAEDDTVSAETAREGLYKWIGLNKDKWETQQESQEALDKILAKGKITIKENGKRTEYDLSMLNKIDETIGKGDKMGTGNLIAFNRPIDYKYDNVVRELGDIVTANNQSQNDSETTNTMADDINEGRPHSMNPPSQPKLEGYTTVNAPATEQKETIPKLTEAEIEQEKAGNKKIREASDTVADVATDSESTVMKNAGSVAFDVNKTRFDMIRKDAVGNQRFADALVNVSSKNLINDGLDKAHSVAEYSNVEANYGIDKARYDELHDKYGDLEYLQKEFQPEIATKIGDFNVVFRFNNSGEGKYGYQIVDINSPERGATYDMILESDFAQDIIDQANAYADEQTDEAVKIMSAHNVAYGRPGDEARKEIEEYKTLSKKIYDEESYLNENREANEQNTAALTKSIKQMEMQYDAMMKQGLDTSGIKEAYRFMTDMLNYHDEPPLPVQDMTKLQYMDYIDSLSDESISSNQKRDILRNGIAQIDEQIANINADKAYMEKTGTKVPDRYVSNMEKKLADLENEKQAMEYETIIIDSDPDKLREEYEAGKAFEEKYGAGNMDYWVRLFDRDDYKTLLLNDRYSDRDYDIITKDEETVYYALLGRKVLELGDSLDDALGQIGTNPEATRAALQEVFSDAAEYKRFMENEDSGFGMWANREYDKSKEYGRELVESGTLGGIEANAMATLGTVGESIASAWYTLDRLITGKRFNPKASANRITAYKNETRAATRESIDEYYKDNPTMKYIANLGYEIYCNRGDSMMNSIVFGALLPGGGSAILNEFIGAAPMGISAGLNAAIEAVENGADTQQAWFILGTTFLAETATEAITYSNIQEALNVGEELTKETLKQFTIDWLTKSGIEEMLGETTNDIVENWADRMATQYFDNPNYQSEHQKRVDYYYAQGYTEEGEAEAKALEEEMKGYLHTAFVSYISAGTDVMTKVGKAAYNTARSAADVVNGYRSYTKARQRMGFGESMLDYMKQDARDAIASRNQNTQTSQEASEQEAGTAVPSEAAPVTAEERRNNAEQALNTANETYTAAKADYDAAYKEERSKRKALTEAKKDLTKAEKSGKQDRIAVAKEKVDAAQQEYDAAKTAKEEARTRRNEASDAVASARTESEAAAEAYEAETATPEQKQAAADVTALGRVDGSAQTTQTEMIASILDNGDGEETVTEQAKAAATFLGDLLGEDTSYIVQQVMSGTARTGISREVVTTALQNAALGNGAATAVIQSEQFKNATPEEKAQMLADTVEQDQSNPDVQQNIAAKVNDYRNGMVINDLAAQGHFDQAQQAQAKADKAAAETAKAETQLQEKQDALDEATRDVEQKAQAVAENPTDDNMKQHADAVTRADNADESRKQYEEHLAKQQEAQKEADAAAKKATEDAMTSAREISNQKVAQENQQRQQKQEAKAEQQRQQEEAARQAQAEEDERTGKADEERKAAVIEGILDREGLEEGEERDQRREALKDQLEKVKIKLKDLKKPLSSTEGSLALYAFERKLGIPIIWKDLGNNARALYDVDEDTKQAVIILNENLKDKMHVGQAIVQAALHEITHSMEKTNAYKAYRSVVLESLFGIKNAKDALELYKENADFRAKVDQMIVEREMGEDYTFINADEDTKIQKAEREIIADFARLNLNELDVIQRFMDNGLGGRMRNALHNINQALKNYFSGLSGEDRRQAEYFRKAERAFQKAMNEVAETTIHPAESQFSIAQVAQAAGMTFNAETLKLYDKEGNEIDGVNRKITPDEMVKTPVGFLIRSGLNTTDGENAEQARTQPGYVDPTSTAGKALDMMTGLMNMIARYKDSDLVWEIGASTLSSTFSALKSNSDTQYQTTVDFGTICAKTQAIVDVMSRVMLDKIDPETGMLKDGMKPGLTRKEIMKVYDATHNANLSVPCPVCYVFSRWMGVPSLLGQMSQFQKDHVITQKGADGKTVYDKDGRAVIDWDATQAHVDEYVARMMEKYGDKEAINKKKTYLQGKLKDKENQRNTLEESLLGKGLSKEEKANIRKQIDSLLDDQVAIEDELAEVRAFNWVSQALCENDGKFKVDHKFRITPDSVIFDMNRTSEFAEDEKNWTYRTTRGAGMGKAINPYSGETIGDILYGVKKETKGKRQNGLRNPWLHYVEGGKNTAAATQLRNARNRARQQNLLGGQRLQSTSDFRPEWGLDYVMSFLELQAAGSKVQMYTKVAEAIDFFASVGADVNMSIMGKGTGWHEATAEELASMSDKQKEEATINGKVYVMDFSDITGMRYDTALGYKNKYNNVQMILVGMNDTHIRLAMKNSDIDFIIPWHSSGNSKEVLSNLISAVGEKLNTSVDYTTTQSDMKKGETKHYFDENGEKVEYSAPGEQTEQEKQLWDLRMRILTGKANNAEAKGGFTAAERSIVYNDPWLSQLYDRFYVKGVDDACYGVKLSGKQAGQIFPYEYWDTSLTKDQADENGRRFVEYCERMGIIPRFSQFKDDPGYWKLLIDRPMYNNDGTYHEQQTIDVTNARIGQLDESGKLDKSTTDLPTQAQAVYAPKDQRSPKYQEYQQREDNAVMAAEEALGIPYTEKQTEAMDDAQAIQTTDDVYRDGVNPQMSIYGEENEGDLDFDRKNPDTQWSIGGESNEADLDIAREAERNQTLMESGALTAEEVAAYEERYHKRPLEGRRPTEGDAQRAFGDVGGMLEKSDEIANFAKSVVKAQNTYFPDTNFDQINRAVDWIKSMKGGYAEALEKVTSNSFDYRSADGQARMVAMMGLAAAKNDVIAQASLADAFNRQGTDLGRALQARKLFMLMTPEGRKSSLRKMLQNAKDEMGKQGKNVDLSFSEWIYEAAGAAETQEDMRLVQQAALAELGEQLPSNWKDRLNSFRMLSMLANPRTHIRNIIGNAMFIPAVSLKNKLGAVMELGVKQGNKTKTLKPIASKEARAFAREDAETMKGVLTGEAKFSEAAQIKQNQAPLGQFMKTLSDLNGNFLEGEDWFFLKGHYRRALSGWMDANGYTADQLRNDQALLEKGRQYAISEAQKATYRDFSKAAQTLNQISRNGGALGFMIDAALPFKKTPINILRRGIEYSPAGLAKSLTYDFVKMKQYLDYQNGKLDVLPEKALSPTQVIDHICSGLSGTAITALGFLLAGAGAVSCGLDDDEDKFEKAKGNQEYAIKAKLFGKDVTFTLDWAAPMSMPFFVGAAIREQMENEGAVNVNDFVNAIGGMTEPVFNLSMLDGVNSLLKTSSYDESNPVMQILSKMATNYVSSFVPSALGAVTRTIDDTRRKSFVPADQSKGFTGNLLYAHENAQNKIPFYNQENIPVRDIWGNEDTTGFAERLLENFILPGYINEYKNDPIINEMARLYEATGDKAMIPEADPDKTITYTVKSTKEKVKHSLTDKEWDKYKEVRNKTAFNELTELMDNPDYQNASDATQVQMIKDIWSHANKVGQKAVIPDLDVDNSSVATIAKGSKIASTKNEMIKALNAGDYDAYDTMVQALYDEGLEESDVKSKIRDYYRDQYKDAYRKGLDDRVAEIEDILDNTGIDFGDLIDNWQEAVDNEQT